MSNNKKFQPFHLIPVALVASVLFFFQEKPATDIRRAPTSIPKVKHHFIPKKVIMPSPSRSPASARPVSRTELDQLVGSTKE